MVRHRTRTTSGSGGQPQPTSNNLAASDKTPNKSHHNPRHLKHPSKAHKAAAAAGSKNLKNVFLTLMALTVVFSTVAFILFRHMQENRISTPLAVPSVIDASGIAREESLFWGSYRPGVYFGLKTRAKTSDLLFGLMWFIPSMVRQGELGFRHWCEQGDNLESFGWLQHDAKSFGYQEIVDRNIKLSTSFIKKPENPMDWHARVRVDFKNAAKTRKDQVVSLFFYAALDEEGKGYLSPDFSYDERGNKVFKYIKGTTDSFKSEGFSLEFKGRSDESGGMQKETFFSGIKSPGPQKFTDSVLQRLKMHSGNIVGLDATVDQDSNMIIYQVNVVPPFEIDVLFHSSSEGTADSWSFEEFSNHLNQKRSQFSQRFENTFELSKKGFSQEDIFVAQAAMSNLVGGIGYFHGASLVSSESSTGVKKYWDAHLFTAVPSRSFFPRGFLWDEGFHNLLISKWDPRISAQIVGHWMDLLNVDGWIPREQILGLEARAKVPDEFVIQRNENANPPTLILTLHSILKDALRLEKEGVEPFPDWLKQFLIVLWPRLEVWYNWFDQTQKGPVPGSYRWRGRNASAIRELNPKTLTSGLDDYPRASHPTDDERHVDLRCWMALASRLLADIGSVIGKENEAQKYADTAAVLYDNSLLDAMHWSSADGAYADFGLHSEYVKLERPRPSNSEEARRFQAHKPDKTMTTLQPPKLQFVPQFGYISLFPFILEIVDPASPRLKTVIESVMDPDKLYTPFGLRSLSAKTASLYMKKNTEHDPPYWRGPIWININYLTIRALHHYAREVDGPYSALAEEAYVKLRKAVVENVIREYKRTGYIWEQYNDKTGHGQGCRPFTGWSTLIVLLMGEKF